MFDRFVILALKGLTKNNLNAFWKKSNSIYAFPSSQKSKTLFNVLYLSKGLEKYKNKDDNILLLVDLNFEMSENAINDFWNVLSLISVTWEKTRYK